LLTRDRVHAVIVTSTQILEVLLHLLTDSTVIKSLPLLVPSERVAQQAREAGFIHILNAGGADDRSMISALCALQSNASSQNQEPLSGTPHDR
jgi:uroporphyrinogen-III synthase